MPTHKPFSNSSFRIYLVVYTGLILLSGYLIGSNYFSHVRHAEESTLSKLYGIASTLSHHVDLDAIQAVFNKYPLNGDTTGISADPVLRMYTHLFNETVQSNELKTPIYTLSYDSVTDRFLGGIASNGLATYGWHYKSPPPKLKELYHTGGTIPCFDDDHGSWLTAVCPLVNSKGQVFAVIEVDYPFDSFLEEARNELLGNILVSILVMLIIGAITYPLLNQILSAEERAKTALESANKEIKEKSDEVVSSLEYARTIQETMLPSAEEMSGFLSQCVVFNRPRDIVSGDFYWFHQLNEDEALIAVADCTGHGVPGALMSIMGHSYLNEIVTEQSIHSPAQVLERLNEKIKETFNTRSIGKTEGTDGMDLGLCLISKKENQLTFAGARRPLTIIDSGTLRHVSATRRGIGEHYLTTDLPFENVTINIKPDTTFYMYTDGMQDQFGGPNAKKLMRKELCSWFMELESISIDLREEWLQTRLLEWKGIQPQIDDICIVGFRV